VTGGGRFTRIDVSYRGRMREVSEKSWRKKVAKGMTTRGSIEWKKECVKLTDNDDVNVSLFFSHCEVV
jgi:hypothetical protein